MVYSIYTKVVAHSIFLGRGELEREFAHELEELLVLTLQLRKLED